MLTYVGVVEARGMNWVHRGIAGMNWVHRGIAGMNWVHRGIVSINLHKYISKYIHSDK